MAQPSNGHSIHTAVQEGDLAGVEGILAEHPHFIHLRHISGSTPLHWAVAKGHPAIVSLLLTRGASANERTGASTGWTPLHLAASHGHLAIALLLIEAGADPNAANKNGDTPLHLAAWRENIPFIEMLLAHGARVNAEDKEGKTALYWAVCYQHGEIADFLRQNGARLPQDEPANTSPSPAKRKAFRKPENLLPLSGKG